LNATSAFTTDEWTVLSDYETRFTVRRAALYTYPEAAAYGMTPLAGIDTSVTPLAASCTPLGVQVFSELNCDAGVTIKQAWAYPAVATDAGTEPLLVDSNGNILAAIREHGANRETLVLTFAQSPSLVHSLALLPDVVTWVTRGVYVGERHIYDDTQIDDLFLSTETYLGDPAGYRISADDMQNINDWQETVRTHSSTPDFRVDWALNGAGSAQIPGDLLTARAQALGPAFKWISHTWDHAYLDSTPPPDPGDLWAGSYSQALSEFLRNDKLIAKLGLEPFDLRNIVTPGVSGLTNPAAMLAAHDAGIRFLVGDTSVAGYNNPTPKAGLWNPLQPDILIIPRRPTNLFYNVSTPDEWANEYNVLYRAYWGRDLTVAEIQDFESDLLLTYLLRGENDPWMFHQVNTRNYGGGHSLLSDLHDSAFSKFAALSRLPIMSPTMEQMGGHISDRMQFNAAGVTATIGPGSTITVHATAAVTAPVTGLCTPTAETYAGRRISYVQLAAGQDATFSLVGCNDGSGGAGGSDAGTGGAMADAGGPDAGTGGAAAVDAGGSDAGADVGGSGGATGSGGAIVEGTGGAVGSGGAPVVVMGSGGATGTGGATVEGTGGAIGTGGQMAPGSGDATGGTGGRSTTVPGDGAGANSGIPIGAGGIGGAIGSGGPIGSGGAPVVVMGSGGATGTGGAMVDGTGGTTGSGGAPVVVGSGGATGSGGAVAAGSGGSGGGDPGAGTGGVSGSGGATVSGSGGAPAVGSGGAMGSGGVSGSGGQMASGSGGATGGTGGILGTVPGDGSGGNGGIPFGVGGMDGYGTIGARPDSGASPDAGAADVSAPPGTVVPKKVASSSAGCTVAGEAPQPFGLGLALTLGAWLMIRRRLSRGRRI
jgi:hypothetical protein